MPVPMIFLAAKAAAEYTLGELLVALGGGGAFGGIVGYFVFRRPDVQPTLQAPNIPALANVQESTQRITKGLNAQSVIQNNTITSLEQSESTQKNLNQVATRMLELSNASEENIKRLQAYLVEIKSLFSLGAEGLNQIDIKLAEFKTFLDKNKMEIGFMDLINELLAQNKLLVAEVNIYQKMIIFFQEQHQPLNNKCNMAISK